MLPIAAAIGGVAVPALIHLYFNFGLPTQAGIGIPMATDIAFAIGVLSMLGNRIPTSLKVFVVAFAIADDLIAIIIIALFYSNSIAIPYLLAALATIAVLALFNKMRIMSLVPYLLGGAILWFLMLKSGIHATVAGVVLAFTIPFSGNTDQHSPRTTSNTCCTCQLPILFCLFLHWSTQVLSLTLTGQPSCSAVIV